MAPPEYDHFKDICLPKLSVKIIEEGDLGPSMSDLQSEDHVRRSSITMYQMVDTQHPDVREIQKIVERMKFTEL